MALPASVHRPEGESLARMTLEGIPGGVMVLDSGGRVLLATSAALKLIGGEVENVSTDTATAEDFPRREVFKILSEACKSGSPLTRLVTFDRERRHFIQVEANPVPDGDGEKRLVVLISDLTASVAQGDMVREFVRQVRHDLRGPLTSVRGAADLLRTERLGPLDDRQRKLLDLVGKAVTQMTSIVSGETASPAVTGTVADGAGPGGK